jgi:hypothetical protein
MFHSFNELIKHHEKIIEKNIYVKNILFDEYKLLEQLGFCVNYSLISGASNNDAIEAYEAINKNNIDLLNNIKNKELYEFIKINKYFE